MLKVLYVLLILLFSFQLQAQQDLFWNRISTDDGFGLASNVVTALYQDKKGFIWVGGNNGLQRFDGSKFIYYAGSREGFDELPVSDVSQILPVSGGKLLLLFGLIRELGIFDPATFEYKRIKVKTVGEVQTGAYYNTWKDMDEEIYLNIAGYGLLHYDTAQHSFVNDSHFHLPPGYIPTHLGVFPDSVKKQVWFACNKGLCLYDVASKETWWTGNNPRQIPQLDNPTLQDIPHRIFIDSQRRFWELAWPGGRTLKVYCLDSAGNMLPDATKGLFSGERYEDYAGTFETSEKTMWIFGEGALYNFNKNAGAFRYNKSMSGTASNSSLNYERVYQIMEDRDGSIWLATDKGLYTASRQSSVYASNNYLGNFNLNVTDILETSNNNYWVANWGAGLALTDSNFNMLPSLIYKTPPPANWLPRYKDAVRLTWAIAKVPGTGQLLVACQDGVLFLFNPATGAIHYYKEPKLQGRTARCMATDSSGNIWIGSQGGRLLKYKNGVCTLMQQVKGIIYKIFVDRQGLVWFNTNEAGLYAIDTTTGKILQQYSSGNHADHMFTNTGKDAIQLNDSIIVAADGPLHFINKHSGKVKIFGYESGLPSNNVYRICKDASGYLWIITSEGLCRYNPGNNRITVYGKRDGIALAAMTTEAGITTSTGTIVFGGNNALLSFRPEYFNTKDAPPDVSITDFKIFNEYIPVDSLLLYPVIKLAPDQNSFSIYFSSLSYQQRDRLTYYYRMEGIDNEWRSDAHYQNYSLLPPGRYTFSVYCENMEGVRSANTTSINLFIKPPFWKTKWFISLLLFLLALVVYGIHNARVNRLLAVEKLRNKVARDLHDDMGSTLSTINILSSMVKTKIGTDTVKAAEYLGKISDNSQRMMDAMDDIVWSITPSNDSMPKITARMREFATSVLEAKDIDFIFLIQEEIYVVTLEMAARRDFFLIFKEAINNAAKYSGAHRVEATISLRQKNMHLLIVDNGKGFDLKQSDNGNGINNMKKRAESMRGVLNIETAPGAGCCIALAVPVNK